MYIKEISLLSQSKIMEQRSLLKCLFLQKFPKYNNWSQDSMKTFELLLYFNIISFLFFGVTCLFGKRMITEFERFKLTKNQRILTGILQLIGVLGLIIGIKYTVIGFLASLGLALLMTAGFFVRLRIKDGVYRSSPALIYLILNLILAYRFFLKIS